MIDFSLIEKKYVSLPPKRRELLFARKTADLLLDLAEENGLTEKGAEEFFDETGLLILGINNREEFQKNIKKIIETSSIGGTDESKSFVNISTTINRELLGMFEEKKENTSQTQEQKKPIENRTIPKTDGTVKEELELRPRGVPRPEPGKIEEGGTPKPLTREDVLSALASRRTMASDIASVKRTGENRDE